MNPTRRAVLLGIPGVVAAPAIVRASSIMKIRPFAEFPVTVETPFDETLWRELARRRWGQPHLVLLSPNFHAGLARAETFPPADCRERHHDSPCARR
jgi:hypothetical protein